MRRRRRRNWQKTRKWNPFRTGWLRWSSGGGGCRTSQWPAGAARCGDRVLRAGGRFPCQRAVALWGEGGGRSTHTVQGPRHAEQRSPLCAEVRAAACRAALSPVCGSDGGGMPSSALPCVRKQVTVLRGKGNINNEKMVRQSCICIVCKEITVCRSRMPPCQPPSMPTTRSTAHPTETE
eukprot:gene10181-biopygen6269